MAILNNNPLIGSGGNQGYNINNSLRFRSSASAYLNRTPASAGNRKTWTWSAWVKRGALGATYSMFSAYPSDGFTIRFQSDDTLRIYDYVSSYNIELKTTQVFRDPSAWYHIVFAVDTTQATSSNRCKLYVNSVQVTAFSTATYPTQNSDLLVNSTTAHFISKDAWATNYLDGYLTEINFIDGQALTPSSFGETDTTTGVWKPKAYSGTYGTNGFYLKFSDISTTSGSNAGLGKDFSGNTNYWTTNNISVTSGTTYDAMTDVPTNTSATVANYPVFNVVRGDDVNATYSEGNLKVTLGSASVTGLASGNMNLPTSGKWYWEIAIGNFTQWINFGILVADKALSDWIGFTPFGYSVGQTGNKFNNDVGTSYASAPASNDVWGIAFDATNGKLYFAKNGTWQASGDPVAGTNAAFTGLTSEYIPAVSGSSAVTQTFNFGQRPFAYTPPTGFVALNTYNLPTPTILQGNKYMDATLWTGDGTSSRAITNAGSFRPDLVWVKARSVAYSHRLTDSVRGANKQLYSDLTNAETSDTNAVTAFNTNGFQIGNQAQVNENTTTFVGWQWQAGQGSTSSGTGTGGITSVTMSVNATAGFSIVTYTGSGANGTVTHGLGVAPKWVIVKARSVAGENWQVYSSSLTSAAYRIRLNATDAQDSQPTMWNSTAPTSTVFSIGTSSGVNTSAVTYVAYCWAEIAGFSKFGSYTGNGSADGVFIYLGFRPKFIIIKKSSAAGDSWYMKDTSRSPYNVGLETLLADTSGAEAAGESWDALSNGIKLRTTSSGVNTSGATYIYAAFAESPFRNSLAR